MGTQSFGLTTASSQGCDFSISYAQVPGSLPPKYNITLTRGGGTCTWGAASILLGSSYSVPNMSLVGNSLGIAAAFTYKNSPSGSAATIDGLRQIAPDTMATVRSADIYPRYGVGNIWSGELSIATDGTTLIVQGTKGAVILGELGAGSNYIGAFPNFFTSTTAPTFIAY